MVRTLLRKMKLLVLGGMILSATACGSNSPFTNSMVVSEEFKQKMFKEPDQTLSRVAPRSAHIDVYDIVDVKVGANPSATSISARAIVVSSAGRETVELVGMIRPDGSASLTDLNPVSTGRNRLIAEASCADIGVCKNIIVNMYYNVGGQTRKKQFASAALLAPNDVVAPAEEEAPSAPVATQTPKPDAAPSADPAPTATPSEAAPESPAETEDHSAEEIHESERDLVDETDESDTTLGEFVGAPRNEILIGQLYDRPTVPALPPTPPRRQQETNAAAAPQPPRATATPRPTVRATATPRAVAPQAPRATPRATPRPAPRPTATPKPPSALERMGEFLGGLVPRATATPRPTPRATATPRPVVRATATPRPAPTAAPRAQAPRPAPTATPTPRPQATAPRPQAPAPHRPAATPIPIQAQSNPDAPLQNINGDLPFPPATPPPNLTGEALRLARGEMRTAPFINLRDGGIAQGGYSEQRGLRSAIANASRLPDSGPGFRGITINANAHFGSGALVSFLQNSAYYLFRELGLTMVIGDMSAQRGGRVSRTTSHQTHKNGLDADIAYLGIARPMIDSSLSSNGRVVSGFNFEKTWEFLKIAFRQEFISEAKKVTAISRVFMSPRVKDGFCSWAKDQNLLDDPKNVELMRLIRRERNHDKHFHLSLKCSPYYPTCRNLAGPPPAGAGCN